MAKSFADKIYKMYRKLNKNNIAEKPKQVVRVDLQLSSGVEYIEFHYLDVNDKPCFEQEAIKCIAYEYNKNGEILRKLNCHMRGSAESYLDDVIFRLPEKTKRGN